MPLDPAEMSRPEKIKAAIQYRARGHSLRWIGERLEVHNTTVLDWTSTPEAASDIQRYAREDLPDLDDDSRLARIHLRDRLGDTEVPGPERDKVAAVLLSNCNRAIEVAAKAKEADAATSQAKTAAQLKTLEIEAMEYLDEVKRRQAE